MTYDQARRIIAAYKEISRVYCEIGDTIQGEWFLMLANWYDMNYQSIKVPNANIF